MINLLEKTEYENNSYEELLGICRKCSKCGLSSTRTNVVPGQGNIKAVAMVIGEGPGEQEDLQGRAFIGKAGQLLTKIFESVGIDREKDLFITNVVKCRPPENRKPEEIEIESCRPYLIRQIQIIKPRVLVLLGSSAVQGVLELKDGITKIRGTWFKVDVEYMAENLYIMPMFHPSYLLRQASKELGSPKWLTWQDMKELRAAMDLAIAERSAKEGE